MSYLSSFSRVALPMKSFQEISIMARLGKPVRKQSSASLSMLTHLCKAREKRDLHRLDSSCRSSASIVVPDRSNSPVIVLRRHGNMYIVTADLFKAEV